MGDRNHQPLHGLILAGGQSSRMGTDKALLQVQGQSMLYRLAGQLLAENMTVTIAAGSPERESAYRGSLGDLAAAVGFAYDAYPGCGPLSGLHAGLSAIRSGWVFVVACDMPSISVPLLERMRSNLVPNVDIDVIHAPRQPMHALYKASAHAVIEQALQRGDYRFMRLLAQLQTLEVTPTIEEASNAFANLNTPEAYAQYVSGLEERTRC